MTVRVGKCNMCGGPVRVVFVRMVVGGVEEYRDFFQCMNCDRTKCSKCRAPEESGWAFAPCRACGHPVSLGT